MGFIDQYSWKCLLGRQSKNLQEQNNVYKWNVGKKVHFCTSKILTKDDFDFIGGSSFHYLSIENTVFLKEYMKIERTKNISTTIDLKKLDLSGGIYKKLRQSINKNNKYNFCIEDNYRKIGDVKDFIEDWSNILAEKYFRDFSGKNLYFYENNFHKDCINVFVYEGDKLLGFATASPNNPSVYIIGKAACYKYSGLSEYIDYVLYQKCLSKNIDMIDLGQTTGGMVFYKTKFPGADTYTFYNGKIL